jgi:Ni/Fe-hydrogenase subunit HybB-like protein
MSLFVIQILLGMLIPLGMLVVAKVGRLGDELRRLLYFTAAILIQLGIFATRWNVVIGGQLFSKSFRGLMAYKMEVMGIEGLATALAVLALPFVVLAVLIRLLPTKPVPETSA